MTAAVENIPSEVLEIISAKDVLLAEKDFRIQRLEQELAQLKRMVFGAKSERFISAVHPSQLSLEIETANQPPAPAVETITIEQHERQKNTKRNPPVRQPFPADLHREVITIYPEGYNEQSPEKPIGKEVTEVLEEIPGKFFVKRYERLKYAKPEGSGIAIGELPTRPIEKGLFGELLLTRIIIDKYCDHLPLHRQWQRFKRAGIDIAYSTLGDVPKQIADLLELLYEELKTQTLHSDYLQADETPHPVLDSKVKKKTHRGFLWVYRSIKQKLVLFDYRISRSREVPQELLKEFSGFLQTDGYSVYDEFALRENITLVGCMALARRYFEKALENDRTRAQFFIEKLQPVYALEREIKTDKISEEKIISLRKEKALPVLKELEQWLKDNVTQVTPQSPIGKAIAYALPRWKKLMVYIDYPFLEIDNNLVENAIRPTVLGRKNYLFSGSHDGAQRSAMMYSFIGSCKMNDVNPADWLADILPKIPTTKKSDLHTLLPNSWKKNQQAR